MVVGDRLGTSATEHVATHELLEVRGPVPNLDLALTWLGGLAGPNGQAGGAVAVQPGPAQCDPLAEPMAGVGEVPHPRDRCRGRGGLVVAGQVVEVERGQLPDQLVVAVPVR